jgi:type 1 fimbria pilin
MRKLLVGLVFLLAATPALADISGTYDVKFEDVSTNCTTQKLTYKPQPISVKVKANQVTIDVDMTPVMTGVPQKAGKVSAKSKAGNTMISGMKGVFSIAGKITNDGALVLVMVGEYTNEQGKPLCTQSWNVSGPRIDAKPRK